MADAFGAERFHLEQLPDGISVRVGGEILARGSRRLQVMSCSVGTGDHARLDNRQAPVRARVATQMTGRTPLFCVDNPHGRFLVIQG